jgi:hypothetical protein
MQETTISQSHAGGHLLDTKQKAYKPLSKTKAKATCCITLPSD